MKRAIYLLLILGSVSCSITTPGGMSPANVPITDYGYVQVVGPVEGSHTTIKPLWFLEISKPDLRKAMSQAMQKANADALVDITWDFKYTNWVILPFMTVTVKVKGTAIRFEQ